MKILFYDWALHTIGGGQKFNCKIVEYLSKEHEVDLLTLFPVKKENLAKYYSVNLSRVKILNLSKKNEIHTSLLKLFYSRKISKLSSQYDLFLNADAQEIIKPLAKHNILYCHFFEPKWYRPPKNFFDFLKLIGIYFLKSVKRNYSKSYQVYCNSEYTRKWLKKIWGVKAKVIYPPIDLPNQKKFRKEKIIISTGRISPDKNYEFVIESFKKAYQTPLLKDYKLWICGKEDDHSYLIKLKKISKGFPIEFKLNLTDKKFKNIYKKSKIFIQGKGININENKYPSLLEHFGMTVVEAMSYGCVPIALNKGGYKESIDDETGFKVNTQEEVVKCILKLVKNESLLSNMSKSGIKRAKKFSLEKMQEKIDKLLINL
ncbi:MAG: glycosyltransferase family 4 protein [Nanoarchaeota archaeon]|nr:glycosyltransferase family 4 protein [Nanoarchaeota archaeon]